MFPNEVAHMPRSLVFLNVLLSSVSICMIELILFPDQVYMSSSCLLTDTCINFMDVRWKYCASSDWSAQVSASG